MSNSEGERLDVESRLSAIELALRGDLKGNAGALQNLIRLMNDVYQAPDGMRPRIKSLEDWKNSREERAKGAFWSAKVFWTVTGFVAAVVLKYFKIL